MLKVRVGSVSKPATVKLYADEIEKLYRSADCEGIDTLDSPIDMSEGALEFSICKLCSKLLVVDNLNAEDNFFELGGDSLFAVTVAAGLKQVYPKGRDKVSARLIYSNPSVRELSIAFHAVVEGLRDKTGAQNRDPTTEVHRIVDRCLNKLQPNDGCKVPRTVLLTGSTGSLGSHILDRLLADSWADAVICFNRATNGYKKQHQGNKERDLPTDFGNVSFWHGDLSKPQLGLSDVAFRWATESVRYIIRECYTQIFG